MGSTTTFDERANSWDADPNKTARASAVAEGIRTMVPLSRRMRALEYGCGTGLLSFALQGHIGQIVLADNSPGMLEVLERKIAATNADDMRSIKLDLAIDPLPDDRFDLIYSLMTFHHIEDTSKLLRDLFALLKTPGYLCIADLDAEDGSFHGPGFSGHCGFDRKALAAEATRAGFKRTVFSTVFRIVKRASPGQQEFPLFLMVAEKR